MHGERLQLFILLDCILKQLCCATKVSGNVQMELSPTLTTVHVPCILLIMGLNFTFCRKKLKLHTVAL